MAITLDRLKELLAEEGLRYFIDPDRDALMIKAGGVNGVYDILFLLELDGRFLQLRSLGYLHCPADHPNLEAVLRVLGHLNYRLRLVKFGWDPSDGEIVVYADTWIMDGDLTGGQFGRIVSNYLPSVDISSSRIRQTMETGEDPGEIDPTEPSRLPDPLRELLERLKGEKEDEGEGEADEVDVL